jgi:cellulose synthase/poly-beta-1,6-N-acetylglucosamine synthase-like glycosyltransferase
VNGNKINTFYKLWMIQPDIPGLSDAHRGGDLAAYPDKQILIGEVGWPSNGRQRGAAVATSANQAQFLRRFLSLAESEGWDYFIIEAFDQPHKAADEGAVGAYWGVYDVNREPKFSFHKPIVSIPQWRTLAAISMVLAVITLVALFSDSHALNSLGRSFLALVSFAVATGMVWLIYEYTRQYMTWATLLLGVVMLLAIFGLILVLLVEAHEWAEALWLSKLRRPFIQRELPDKNLPFVSIHVPAYNEPPDMLIETLDALARMDYPHYEVLVIDNNTKDPEIWHPVEKYCEKLGEHFRFFHVDPLDGFKAGALNYALDKTNKKAEVIAVIDSDYLIEPCWLRELTPAFHDPKMAIIQAPQDYRDGNENAFKAMCMAEYRGFFNIGMVTRNERNAIIQHGTMTMVRHQVLKEVDGWSEWCITEDAELGLRVFERGYEALYIPRSYGKGLIPDNFLDFKKQRFRWAYGAVLTMRHHFKELLGTKNTALTRGQRFHFIAGWLPWVSDGLSLIFNMAALFWTVGMILLSDYIDPPLVIFAIFPLAMFAFKILKLGFLYRWRVNAGFRQSIGAAIAGLALSHTISRAMMTGLVNRNIGFFRTPKRASHSAFLQALSHAREELLIMLALWVGAFGVITILDEGGEIDIRMWAIMLLVQSIPYAAAVLMSLISAMPKLPARLIGSLGELENQKESVYTSTTAPAISDQPPREP